MSIGRRPRGNRDCGRWPEPAVARETDGGLEAPAARPFGKESDRRRMVAKGFMTAHEVSARRTVRGWLAWNWSSASDGIA